MCSPSQGFYGENNKLTYEEWKTQNPIVIPDNVIETLKMFHGVDAEKRNRRTYQTRIRTLL